MLPNEVKLPKIVLQSQHYKTNNLNILLNLTIYDFLTMFAIFERQLLFTYYGIKLLFEKSTNDILKINRNDYKTMFEEINDDKKFSHLNIVIINKIIEFEKKYNIKIFDPEFRDFMLLYSELRNGYCHIRDKKVNIKINSNDELFFKILNEIKTNHSDELSIDNENLYSLFEYDYNDYCFTQMDKKIKERIGMLNCMLKVSSVYWNETHFNIDFLSLANFIISTKDPRAIGTYLYVGNENIKDLCMCYIIALNNNLEGMIKVLKNKYQINL